MSLMNELRKRIKSAAEVTAEVMNSPCCDEDEEIGRDPKLNGGEFKK